MESTHTASGIELVKIADPEKAGDYLWIARADYNPAIHRAFESPSGTDVVPATSAEQAAPSAPAPIRESSTGEPASSGSPASSVRRGPRRTGNQIESYDTPIKRR